MIVCLRVGCQTVAVDADAVRGATCSNVAMLSIPSPRSSSCLILYGAGDAMYKPISLFHPVRDLGHNVMSGMEGSIGLYLQMPVSPHRDGGSSSNALQYVSDYFPASACSSVMLQRPGWPTWSSSLALSPWPQHNETPQKPRRRARQGVEIIWALLWVRGMTLHLVIRLTGCLCLSPLWDDPPTLSGCVWAADHDCTSQFQQLLRVQCIISSHCGKRKMQSRKGLKSDKMRRSRVDKDEDTMQ